MSLSLIEKLDLQKEVVTIFEQIESAALTQKLAFQQRIIEIWELLGVNEQQEEKQKSLVDQFKDGDFDSSPSERFIAVLEELEPFVGDEISLKEVIDHSNTWWNITGIKEVTDIRV